jgi:cyclopropane-fatty-acyl-phospholipid synthase
MPSVTASSSSPAAAWEIRLRSRSREWLNSVDPYTASLAFVRGEIEVEGDLVSAVRDQLNHAARGLRTQLINLLGRLTPWRLLDLLHGRRRTARDIRFHYDRSNDFYRAFLDPRMVYSCAYFRTDGLTLAEAQKEKLDLICRKLRLHPGERFLDIGCGWGALLLHAAERYGVQAVGCTLSSRQVEYARAEVHRRGLGGLVCILGKDYRDVDGCYDKIASVGMFEHVGRSRLKQYFRTVAGLLAPEGVFLNHGITKPENTPADAQSLFIVSRVFPGGRIVHLGDVVEAAEQAGLEVVDVENLRRHYALTCRAWVERLRSNREACLRAVDEETWRTWQLYLAGSAVAFEEGSLNLHQVLFTKKGARAAVPMTRADLFLGD